MRTMSPEPAVAAPEAAPAAPGPDPLLDRFMRHQRRARDFDLRRPWVLDTAVSAFVFLVSLADLLPGGRDGDGGPFQAESDAQAAFPFYVPLAFALTLALAVWWRRRHPTAVFFIVSTLVFTQWAIGLWQPAGMSVLIALYALASLGSLRLLAWAVAMVVVETSLLVLVLQDIEEPLLGLFFLLGTVTAAVALGLTVRVRRLYTAALEDRARRLEVERDQRERLIASAERARIAREMHDILGHTLSVMVTLADGAATLAVKRGEPSAGALRMLGDTGREAMGELRRVLGVLRADDRDSRSLSPQPGVADLDTLLERVRAAGLTVTCQTSGHLDRLSPSVQLTVYRIIQEALTNTLKHAGLPASAAVTLTASAGEVRIRVADTGVPRPAPDEDREPGHGLIGIRQRAALYGGTATIGPREVGTGWIVDVVLQRHPAPDTEQAPS